MARELKLERLFIPPVSRVVKDWFPTRESVEAVVAAILTHISTTGQTHTCFCHTHTKPPMGATVVYIREFELPERFRKAKRFCPCPCCWDEFGKFGQGKIAWFPDERVIRIIGDDCFAGFNPEGHAYALDQLDTETKRRNNTNFLLANCGRLPEVIVVIEDAIVVGQAVEEFHRLLHNRLRMVGLKLWPYVRRAGEMQINVREQEFRRGVDGEMYSHEVHTQRTYAVLDGYPMLDPASPGQSASLQRALGRIQPLVFGENWRRVIEQMTDERRYTVAQTLSRSVKVAKERIAEIEVLRRFPQRVNINHIGQIDFWTDMEPRVRRR